MRNFPGPKNCVKCGPGVFSYQAFPAIYLLILCIQKGYDVEMWDLGLQEWVHVASTEIPELTLSNILSGILYRFRVTALTADGNVSFPSDPSEPFVIDIPGVQV